jgi:hypothetical protein
MITNRAVVKNVATVPLKDFETTLTYRGKKVAIYSQGDTQRDCYAAIEYYSSLVDVLFLAHSSVHQPLNIDAAIHTEHKVDKTIARSGVTEVESNANDCKRIVRLI